MLTEEVKAFIEILYQANAWSGVSLTVRKPNERRVRRFGLMLVQRNDVTNLNG